MLNLNSNILVVDDMVTVCEMLTEMLGKLGYKNVTKATNAADARSFIEACAQAGTPYDLVLSDINMPGESGLDLLEWIQKNAALASLSVIMISAAGDIDNVTEAVRLGAKGFIVKPIRLEVLKEKLASF